MGTSQILSFEKKKKKEEQALNFNFGEKIRAISFFCEGASIWEIFKSMWKRLKGHQGQDQGQEAASV